jgi:hypothetical protein
MYFVYVPKTMKPAEIILKTGMGMGENDGACESNHDIVSAHI